MVVPVWKQFPSDLPYGLCTGRQGPLRSPEELQHLLSQLHHVTRHYTEKQAETLAVFEHKADQLGSLIQSRIARMEQLDDAIQKKERELESKST